MKHCMYCDALMASDAIFCPKCGRRQKENNNKSKSNVKTDNYTFNINAQPPATLGSRDYQPESINAYKRKIGFNTGTSNVLFAYAGSMMGRSMAGNLVGGSVGSYIGAKSLKTFILSFEKQGILVLSLDFRYNFTGKNNFISKNKIKSCYKTGFQSLCIELNNNNEIDLSIPHWLQLPYYQGANQKSLFSNDQSLYESKYNQINNRDNNPDVEDIAEQDRKNNQSKPRVIIFNLVVITLLIVWIIWVINNG